MKFHRLSVLLLAVLCGAAASAAALPAHAEDDGPAARATRLREEISSLPALVRSIPNIYLIRIESVETELPSGTARSDDDAASRVTATVKRTLKGKKAKKLTLSVRQRRPGAAEAGLFGGDVSGDPGAFQKSPSFFSPERFLSARNPMAGGPRFEKGRLYLVFTDISAGALLGGPYGYQPVSSETAFWVQTVKNMVANPDIKHAVDMSFRDFITRHRSAFLMVVGDCLGTEVSISEPLWGEPVTRKDIDPGRILPESAEQCAGAMDKKRGYLGLIEARPWLYQVRRGYPNQSYVEIRDGMLDFSELGLDIGFPDGGKIAVADLAERLSGGAAR